MADINEAERIIKNTKDILASLADDVWPDGWNGTCRVCGKPFHYTKNECIYYLGHGWPRCDHKPEIEEGGDK